jgi:hypothetical protein
MCVFQWGTNRSTQHHMCLCTRDFLVVNEKEKGESWDAFCKVGPWWRSLWWDWLKDSCVFFLCALPKANWCWQLQRENFFIMVSIHPSVQSCIILLYLETARRSSCEYSGFLFLNLRSRRPRKILAKYHLFCVLKPHAIAGKVKNWALLFEVENTKQA